MIQLDDHIKQCKSGETVRRSDAAQSASVRSAEIRSRLLQQEFTKLYDDLSPNCTLKHADPNKLHEFTLTVKPLTGYWAGGKFTFEIIVPEGYNNVPPKVRCVTPIWHPNIDKNGNLCLSILRPSSSDLTGWAPTRCLRDVICGIELLFSSLCDFKDALNTEVADQYENNRSLFEETVAQYMRRKN